MSTFILINPIIYKGERLLPGSIIDDAVDDVTSLQNAGAFLITSGDPIVAAAGVVARNSHIFRGADEATLAWIMEAAVNRSQGSIQTGTVTLVAGVATVNTGITLTANSKVLIQRKTQGGTITTTVEYEAPSASRVVGGPGVGTLVFQASVAAGTVQNTDTSVLEYAIFG